MSHRRLTIGSIMGVIGALALVLAVVRRLTTYEVLLLILGTLLAILLGLAPLVVRQTIRESRAARRPPADRAARDPGSAPE